MKPETRSESTLSGRRPCYDSEASARVPEETSGRARRDAEPTKKVSAHPSRQRHGAGCEEEQRCRFMNRGRILFGCLFAAYCLLPVGARAQVITEFNIGGGPDFITAGPDGNLWFTEYDSNRIGRMTPLGVVTEFRVGITDGARPFGITAGPDGNLWFTEYLGGRTCRLTPLGVITEFSDGISPSPILNGITAGPDGNLSFTEQLWHRIGRIKIGRGHGCTAV